MLKTACVLVLSTLALLVAGCGKSDQPKPSEKAPASALPDSFWLKSEPGGAKPVGEVRAAAKSGDQVVVTGAVGGSLEPFTANAAVFTIVDKSIKGCTEDHCPTPWDYCCEPPENLKKNMVTVEFREKGALVKTPARGFHGLEPGKNVVVAGEAKKDEAGNVVVVASGVFISP